MTGLLRTTLFFFLPVFAMLFAYQTWVADPYAKIEARQEFLAHFEPLVESVKKAATESLQDDGPVLRQMPTSLLRKGAFLTEGISNGQPVIRLLSPTLEKDGDWKMAPDPSVRPSFLTGFRISTTSEAVTCFLVEETIYDPQGNPVALNIYIREEGSSHDDSN